MPDPLVAPANAPKAIVYIVNVLFQLDCLVACMLTGQRNKTISCWLGEAEKGVLGSFWRWALIWLWWPVNFIARKMFNQIDHCEESIGPFIIEENKL